MGEDSDVALQPIKGPEMGGAPQPAQANQPGPKNTGEDRVHGTWPDLGHRAVKIPTKDYTSLYGMWRGKECQSLSPQEAVFKFIQSENLQRLNVHREHRGFARVQTLMPLQYVHGVKVGYGKHAASGVVPTDGEIWEREIVQNPGSPSDSVGDVSPPLENWMPAEKPPTTAIQATEKKRSRRQRHADSRLSLNSKFGHTLPAMNQTKSHLQRPYDYGVQRKTWHAPEWKGVLPRVSVVQHYTQKEFDKMSIRELLGRSLPVEPTQRMPTAGTRLTPLPS